LSRLPTASDAGDTQRDEAAASAKVDDDLPHFKYQQVF